VVSDSKDTSINEEPNKSQLTQSKEEKEASLNREVEEEVENINHHENQQ
jgi:hypothetical protein